MKTDYRAIRDFLERRYPQRWGRTERIIHEGGMPVVPPTDETLTRLASHPHALEKYNEFLAAFAQTVGSQSGGTGSPSQ